MRWVVILGLAQAAYILAIAWELNFGSTDAEAVHIDFVAFWAAARLAVAGHAEAAFDARSLVAAQSLGSSAAWETYGWFYPPTFHMLITPLGLLPFTVAFALFSACGLVAFALAAKMWSRERFALAVVSPPVLFVLLTGNVSLLWTAGLLGGVFWIGNPMVAGGLIALLTMKPQLGVLIPVALAFGRRWSVIIWAAGWTSLLVCISIILFGASYWKTFLSNLSVTSELLSVYGQNAVTMVTWYAFSRQIGTGHDTAIWIQVAFTLAAAVAVAFVWARDGDDIKKIAVLCLAIPLATPYAFQYELVLVAVASVLIPRLLPLWALPLPAWLINGVELAQYAAPLLTAGLVAALAARAPASTIRTPSSLAR